MTTARQGRPSWSELGRALRESSALTSDWVEVFEAVPRSAFLPDLMWPWDMESGQSVAVSRTEEPERWQSYADSDLPIVTQWDDGDHTGREPGTVATSSASMPSVVFRMLQVVGPEPGDKVLEIGSATGWNAALIGARTGSHHVVTMEVDSAVADHARARLGRFGSAARVVHGDGFAGCPGEAPYDRVVATCGVRRFPWAWAEQCRPGGVVVAPWGTHFSHADAVARLVVAADGASASGHFTGPVEFMKLRSQRRPPVVHREYVTGSVADGDESSSSLTEADFTAGQFHPLPFALGLRVRDCARVVAARDGDTRPVWLYSLSDRSWACCQFRDGRPARVWEHGPRRLWRETEAAYRWWVEHDRPGHTRFGLTIGREGEWAWLDSPENPVAAPSRQVG